MQCRVCFFKAGVVTSRVRRRRKPGFLSYVHHLPSYVRHLLLVVHVGSMDHACTPLQSVRADWTGFSYTYDQF